MGMKYPIALGDNKVKPSKRPEVEYPYHSWLFLECRCEKNTPISSDTS